MAGFEFRVRAVLFDLDGTLVNSDAVVERVWRVWAARVGIDPASFLDRVHGRPGQEVMAEVLPDRPAEVNLAENAELLTLETAYADEVVALPGAGELLASLADWPWAVVTACTEPAARARLAAAGLPTPEVLVTADQLSAGKPEPEGYLTAATRLGIAPNQCLVVEDAPAGVRAGLAAGMPVLAVGTRDLRAVEPTARVPGLADLEVLEDGVQVRVLG
ncbi:HAD-IA family hydrolase [Amycolatopsis anabasis]|uniref:HAD-IA family hydrolase n=1 Tax=Amycolatopsis anabasis TaxID=1840409 RepID=UPI00131B56AF|nr:HAD-IA family hydrolase [Amycolatopsis anabasis]